MRVAAITLAMLAAWQAPAHEVVALPGQSPLVTFRIVFRTGSAYDPPDKPGLAALTASMMSDGGTKTRTYKQIVDAFYPMAVNVNSQTDKEMTTFTASTHVDNLEVFYAIFREMLLNPGWRPDDLTRVRDNQINFLRENLRGNNDEELAKEVLYNRIYRGHPYGHHSAGTVAGLGKITIQDMQEFYKTQMTRANLIVGLAGGYPPEFLKRVERDFGALPAGKRNELKLPAPAPITAHHVTLVDKRTRSVAYSLGFPIQVKRGDPDFPALLLAQAYFGQHRNSTGVLYQRMRETRGLNYGDYAYIEYFPRGMFQFAPDPNLARRQQIFQIWIRPVEPPTAHFSLRLALVELQKLVAQGLTESAFEETRSYLTKSVNLLTKTKSDELGYAIDSKFYGIPEYGSYVKNSLAKLTRDDVNRAIRKHLRADRLEIVAITDNAAELRKKLLSNEPSPMTYNSPKPEHILAEDKQVQNLKLALAPDAVETVPVAKIFE